jgi:ubiquinone/menaquinone biosynthesis C-methylase UbiE
MLSLGLWENALMETRARRLLINRLELEKNASVLETGAGTGSNLPIIADQIGKEGQLDGSDISSGILKVARRKMKAKGIRVELIQANASYLPYRMATFDAVLHVGGLNVFADKKRAIEEMHRVAKPGAKIVICDEGLAPGKEKTWLGRRILKRDKEGLFTMKPPTELLPDKIEDAKVY